MVSAESRSGNFSQALRRCSPAHDHLVIHLLYQLMHLAFLAFFGCACVCVCARARVCVHAACLVLSRVSVMLLLIGVSRC